MQVPLPRLCSVFAHEMRSPLGVPQGYVRLLQRERTPDHPETPMLDATGRLGTLARQASDLGNWLAGLQHTPLPLVETGAVFDAHGASVEPADPPGSVEIRFPHTGGTP